MTFRKHIGFTIIFFAVSSYLFAQSSYSPLNRDVLNLEDLKNPEEEKAVEIVSALRSSRSESALPFTIYIITAEDIRNNGYITLVDALKSLPGIRVSQPGSGEDGETFLMRGLIGNSYTKILINNIPIQPSVTSGLPIGAQLPIREAERIEVIYGPAAAVYGADATAGVINIITRTPERSVHASAEVSLGEYDFRNLHFMAGGITGKNKDIIRYTIFGSSVSRSDYNIYQDPEVFNPLTYVAANEQFIYFGDERIDPLKINRALLQRYQVPEQEFMNQAYLMNYEGSLTRPEMSNLPSESSLLGFQLNFRGFNLSYLDMYRSDPSSLGRNSMIFKFNNPDNQWAESIKRWALSYDYNWNKVRSTTNLSYLRYRLDPQSSIGRTYANPDQVFQYAASDDIFAEQLFFYRPQNNIEILTGLSYQHSGNLPKTNEAFNVDKYTSFSLRKPPPDPVFGHFGFNPIVFDNYAGFVQIIYSIDKFTTIASIRHDYNSLYKGSTNPRLAVQYTLSPKTSIRTSLATAFRAPSANTAYQSVSFLAEDFDIVEYAIVPNPGLRPERLEANEVGLRHQFNENISLDLSAYYNRIENLISSTFVPLDKEKYPSFIIDSVRMNVNSSNSRSRLFGIQTNLRYKKLVPSINLNAELNLNYATGREILPVIDVEINEFRGMPKFLGQLNLDLTPVPNLYFLLENVFAGNRFRRHLPSKTAIQNEFFIIDSYYTLDLMARYRFNQHFEVFGRMINVFGETYGGIDATGLDVDMRYNPQLGRNLQAGLRFKLQ